MFSSSIFAGHDTTVISLAYSVRLLVARPDVQQGIAEEPELLPRQPRQQELEV